MDCIEATDGLGRFTGFSTQKDHKKTIFEPETTDENDLNTINTEMNSDWMETIKIPSVLDFIG